MSNSKRFKWTHESVGIINKTIIPRYIGIGGQSL
jgi:hypothetical protein